MTGDDLRRLALALPEAEEKSHFGKADFRVRDKIFASLPDDARAVVKLTPEEQAFTMAAEPDLIAPATGAWGRKGWTVVHLADADETLIADLLRRAWNNVAPKRLRGG
ncbi:MmcQ/YjbR family DNA-binding protein [Oharaeibacter diazotrophicus]|uniref:Putative DNA-binding protein (MmcQ/YjbR family) n=1 Tax=Oharaeibacter diazotrophicus TaxID=1920512 RepID=A0A4R6RHA0_9HYPH|nr:MmcQ/YjbR family DNA-binding protein [Oharaeibacter diazotrophicus]TDP85207.1 putative DNA-binding protein (MmcQ/YjbR family) [Oharaeibacter diazotrophicus]BBE74177.1 hypothetical protein OHA_1_03805 [Pleomorphomonas sp. SM30]GLS76135.1 hypothetical protein GCM10007904_14700 [Oharaeibacter diazotrophicus]